MAASDQSDQCHDTCPAHDVGQLACRLRLRPGNAARTLSQWTSDAHVVVLSARAVDTYDAIYAVTNAKQAYLPLGADFGYSPGANAKFVWRVQTHDAYENIDAVTTDKGYLSAYATGQIRATRRGAGHFAQSVTRVFTTAP